MTPLFVFYDTNKNILVKFNFVQHKLKMKNELILALVVTIVLVYKSKLCLTTEYFTQKKRRLNFKILNDL